MGFSLLGAFGGAAKQLTTEYTQDKLAEKQMQAQMLGIFLPELINERKERKLKKGRMRELNVALSRYITDDDINLRYNLLAAGEERAQKFVDDVASWEQKTGKRLNNVAEFEKLGMLPPGYEPPKETYENFDDFFKQRIVGNIVPYISDKSSDLQKSIAKSLGARSPEMLKDSVYAQLAAFSGADISTVASDIEGTREIQEALYPGLLSSPMDPLNKLAYDKSIAEAHQVKAALNIGVNLDIQGQSFENVGLAAAKELSIIEENLQGAAYKKAQAAAEGSDNPNLKLINQKFRGMLSDSSKNIGELVGGTSVWDAATNSFKIQFPKGKEDQLLRRITQHAVGGIADFINRQGADGISYANILPSLYDEDLLVRQLFMAAGVLDAQIDDGQGTQFLSRLTTPGKGMQSAVTDRIPRGILFYNSVKMLTAARLQKADPARQPDPTKSYIYPIQQVIGGMVNRTDPTTEEKNKLSNTIQEQLEKLISTGVIKIPKVVGQPALTLIQIMDDDDLGYSLFGLDASITKSIKQGNFDELVEAFKKY